jgi:protein disulfide-isomerase A6
MCLAPHNSTHGFTGTYRYKYTVVNDKNPRVNFRIHFESRHQRQSIAPFVDFVLYEVLAKRGKMNVMTRWLLLPFLLLAQHLSYSLGAALYDNSTSPHVEVITKLTQFQSKVLQSDGIWFVQFFSPENSASQTISRDYSQVATVMRGVFHVAAVDVSTKSGERIAKAYNIGKDLPVFYFFANDKQKPQKYDGTKDLQGMSQALFNILAETIQARAELKIPHASSSSSSSTGGPSKVVHVNGANFAEKILNNPSVVAVAFIAPWCGHCQRLLPEWDIAAGKLDGEGAVLAVVDATVEKELASIYGVNGYPTIKLFSGGAPKKHSDAKEYKGGRTATEIVQYVLDEVDRTGVPKEIPELTSVKVLEENCQGHNRLCILAALPHILDSGAEGRNKYRDLLAKVAKSFRGSAFTFLWFEGSSQPDFEQALELSFGFPALVALSLEKQAYAVLRGSFTEKSISSYLHGITTGRQPTIKLDKLPQPVTVEPWDGKDGVPVEDEIPLSEIMGWDDEKLEL